MKMELGEMDVRIIMAMYLMYKPDKQFDVLVGKANAYRNVLLRLLARNGYRKFIKIFREEYKAVKK